MGGRRRRAAFAGGCLLALAGGLAACDGTAAVSDRDAAAEGDGDAPAPGRASCPGPLHQVEPTPLGEFLVDDVLGSYLGSVPHVSGYGRVHDREPFPSAIGFPVADEGPCALFGAPPPCHVECWCTEAGCPVPAWVDVGEVTLTGLSVSPLTLERREPAFRYLVPQDLSVPSAVAGAEVVLSASGGVHAPFEIRAFGVGELEVPDQSIVLDAGSPVPLRWVPGPPDVPLCMHIELRISELAWIECTVDDTGAFEVPADLVARLLDRSPSLTHYVRLARRSRGVAVIDGSEVRLDLSSRTDLPIEIPGLFACSGDTLCPEGLVCGSSYVCRAP